MKSSAVFGLLVPGLLFGCGGTGVREVRSANGEKIYEAKCQHSGSECIADARGQCGDGYDLLDSESHSGGLVADTLPGPVTWYSMTFKCDGAGGSPRPDFPLRGASYDAAPRREAPISRASSEQTPEARPSSRSKPARRGSETSTAAECTNDYQCGYGNLCVKQQFRTEGICARAVDQSGVPTFTPPRSGSVGIGGEGDCSFDTQCPVGFKCVKGQSLTGHCMK